MTLSFIGSAGAQEPNWHAGFLDPFGAVSSRDVVPSRPTSEQSKALADLRSHRNQQAWTGFKKLYSQDDASAFHLWGLVLAAQGAGRLRESLEIISERFQERRERDLAGGKVALPEAEPHHLVAFNFGLAVAKANDVQVRPLGPAANRWSHALSGKKLPREVRDRNMIVMYSSAMHVLGMQANARPPLVDLVQRNPRDSRLHYVLARLYSEGPVKWMERGKEVPAPATERPNEQLALQHALTAARLEPAWPEARFEAGLLQVVRDPASAKEHFRAYLKLGNPTAKRRATIETFLRTGYWGPPRALALPPRLLGEFQEG